jgi:hypothetical protein
MSQKVNSRFFKGKPKLSANSKYSQGIFIPTNPLKYKGDVNNIVYRSGLELKWYKYLDLNPSIIEWNCEEAVIRYLNPIDNRVHKYFIDVWIKYKNKKNEVKQCLIEIKPLEQTKRPKLKKNKSKSYCYAVNTYIVNVSKWNAAKKIATEKGLDFKILTESGFIEWNIQNI